MNIQGIPIELVEPNKYNPNVLKGEKYEALKKDVAAGNYDPILVSPKDVFYGQTTDPEQRYVIIDGEWRWKAATELELTTIQAEIREIAIFEAKVITYKKNRQRGNMNPFKEALLFQGEVTAGATEPDIAERYGVTRSYVAGRRALLKVSGEVVDLFERPEEKLKERLEKQMRKTIEERRGQPEYKGVTDEEVDVHIEEELGEVVSRGTLTPGHMKALVGLSRQDQEDIAEDVVRSGLTVRQTEEKVAKVHEDMERHKHFLTAWKTAKQKTCPRCGADPEDFNYYNLEKFRCKECGRPWDYNVTKAELEAKLKKRAADEKEQRSSSLKKQRAEPSYIRREETVEQLDEKIKEWLLRKVMQLNSLESIRVVGFRQNEKGDPEAVNIEYPGSAKGLTFNVGAKKGKHDFWHQWKQRFYISMEPKIYKTLQANSKVNVHAQQITPKLRAQAHWFLDAILDTDEDPFLLDDVDVKAYLTKHEPKKRVK